MPRPAPLAPPVPRGVIRRGLGVLWQAVKEEPRIFAVSAVGSALFALTTIAQAYVFGAITEQVIVPSIRDGEVVVASLAISFLAIMLVAVLKVVGIIARRLGAGIMQYRLQAAYRRRVTRRYLELPLSWHAEHPTGELLSNANSDVEATWYPIAPFPFAVGVIVMLVTTLGLLFVTDPVLALVGSIVFPAIAVLTVVYSRRMSPLMTRAQQLRGEVSGIAHESFDGALVVKTLGREADETERFRAAALELRDTHDRRRPGARARSTRSWRRCPSSASSPCCSPAPAASAAATSTPGSWCASPTSSRCWPSRCGRSAGCSTSCRAASSAGTACSASCRPPARRSRGPPRCPPTAAPPALDVAAVSFSYGDAEVLREVGFDVAPGRTVALVGPTGAGKSTLASVLVRLLDPDSGTVAYDDLDVRELAPGALASVASLVPQSTFLFDDTVRGNITLGADIPDEDVWAALRIAQGDGFVAALPKALDTVVGERGTTLSGGQRQRLALARAVVRRPRLLVLDDATSSVDPSVEQRILAGLRDSGAAQHRRRRGLPPGHHRAGRRGRLRRGGPGQPRAAAHEELLASSTGYQDLVHAYERAEAQRQADALEAAQEVGRMSAAASPTVDSRTVERGSFATLAHGLRLTPELREGLVVTLLLALLATAGRVVVPVAVQQAIDTGPVGPGARPAARPRHGRARGGRRGGHGASRTT